MNMLTKMYTAYNLGLLNVGQVIKYRIGLKTGIHPVTKLNNDLPHGRFFSSDSHSSEELSFIYTLDRLKAFCHLPYDYI